MLWNKHLDKRLSQNCLRIMESVRAGKVQEGGLATGLCNMAQNQMRLITWNTICAILTPKPQWVRKYLGILENSNGSTRQLSSALCFMPHNNRTNASCLTVALCPDLCEIKAS